MTPRHYTLGCMACGRGIEEDGVVLSCSASHSPAFIQAHYSQDTFLPDPRGDGLFRYRHWLPIARTLPGPGNAVTYHSRHLGRALGLHQLWILFNGYWPERGATLDTVTFKELEAWTVLSRRAESDRRTLVVASAGNTAAAFARACSQTGRRCLIVVPETAIPSLEVFEPVRECVRIVALGGGADYSDAIAMAGWIAGQPGYVAEGGVKNIARRAGLGTPLLALVEAAGRLPDYYFQAVGSGAGAIGVHESAQRLVLDGRYGNQLPRLMLSQNYPFTPLADAWRSGSRQLLTIDDGEGKRRIQQIAAQVLSNREPPYAIQGGVRDILTQSGGEMLVADNDATAWARRLFQESEGIDIDPAAGVALATLHDAVASGRIRRDAVVALNITGGGRERRRRDWALHRVDPALHVPRSIHRDDLLDRVAAL